MLVAEFATVYGNDWYLVPLDVPVGSLTTLTSVVVGDTFGSELGHLDGPDGEPLRPQGRLLAPGLPNAYDLFAEEVPREGVTLTRSHQYARTRDGRSVLWTARRARPGRGEAQSGLRFDRAEE